MKTKSDLMQYRSLKREISEINRRMQAIEVQDRVETSNLVFPYTQKAITVRGIDPAFRAEAQELRQRRASCTAQCREIEQFIFQIPDSLTRRIFEYRYLEGVRRMSWQWLATQIGGGNTEDGVRKRHDRYLHQLCFSLTANPEKPAEAMSLAQ